MQTAEPQGRSLEALGQRFQAALARGAWDHALALADQLIHALPDNASLHYNKGLILKVLGERDSSVAAFEAALTHDPSHANARFELGAALLDGGSASRAAELFTTYLDAVPDDTDARLNLGIALLQCGRAEDARVELRVAHAAAPSPLAVQSLATAERDCGDLARCRALLDTLPADDPDTAAVRMKILTQGARGSLRLDAAAFLNTRTDA